MNNLPPPSFLSGYGSVMAGNFLGNAVGDGTYKISDVHYVSGAVFAYIWNMVTQSGYLPEMFASPTAFYLTTFGTGLGWGYAKLSTI